MTLWTTPSAPSLDAKTVLVLLKELPDLLERLVMPRNRCEISLTIKTESGVTIRCCINPPSSLPSESLAVYVDSPVDCAFVLKLQAPLPDKVTERSAMWRVGTRKELLDVLNAVVNATVTTAVVVIDDLHIL
jgi:hypothetical protein